MTPKSEWPKIEGEPGDPYLFADYVAILAAIPAVCGFIGMSIVGMGHRRRPRLRDRSLRAGVRDGVRDGAHHRRARADFRRAEESARRAEARSLFDDAGLGRRRVLADPRPGDLGILGLYSLYLFWLGVPLMKIPADNVGALHRGSGRLRHRHLPRRRRPRPRDRRGVARAAGERRGP